ncbi:MAG: hypothetical protein M3151_00665 [Actinomycetota bacterium]|nr:hypothetical protein [Actinomycetota bacterium]
MSAETVALLVLLAGAIVAVAFTLAVVVAVDRSGANTRQAEENEGVWEREGENR